MSDPIHSQPDERAGRIAAYFRESVRIKLLAADACGPAIIAAADLLVESFRGGGKLLLCGNGGSAADCQHVAAEFVSLLRQDRPRAALPAIALTTDTSFLTARANDFGFDEVFSRQVEALGRPGDVLMGISTSGNSRNVIHAVRTAREQGVRTIGLLGEGGALTELVDAAVVIPSTNTQHVQEAMLAVEHILCELTESHLFG
ncbi:MAG TPA: D-sedoheptulose 7-phosphate isomerase [Longimicrobium sp.]